LDLGLNLKEFMLTSNTPPHPAHLKWTPILGQRSRLIKM
jgi:hypothetical protein